MDREDFVATSDLCAAIHAALELAEAADSSLVCALLAEAYDAARCEERPADSG